MKATCMLVRSLAPSTAETALPERLESHASTCLSCQAELARYAKLRRRLAAMAEIVEPAPLWVGPEVAASILKSEDDESSPQHSRGFHLARAAAAAGAVAAASAGAVALWRQSRGIA